MKHETYQHHRIIKNTPKAPCFLLLTILFITPLHAIARDPLMVDQWLEQGIQALSKNQYGRALDFLHKAEASLSKTPSIKKHIKIANLLAEAYQKSAQPTLALKQLNLALQLAEQHNDDQLVFILFNFGNHYLSEFKYTLAIIYFEECAQLAQLSKQPILQAEALNNLGIAYAKNGDVKYAKIAFEEGRAIAKQTNNPLLMAKSHLNEASIAEIKQNTAKFYHEALSSIKILPETALKTRLLMKLSIHFIEQSASLRKKDVKVLYQILHSIKAQTIKSKNTILESYVTGYLGRLYESQNRIDDAMLLTQQAINIAQQTRASESLYLWQWQTGRLLIKQQKKPEPAIKAYLSAIHTLQSFRNANIRNIQLIPFTTKIKPVYYELADIYLQQAKQIQDLKMKQPLLHQAQQIIEKLKVAELEDYFKDDCSVLLEGKKISISQASKKAAVIYPILLKDRTEILVHIGDNIYPFSFSLTQEQIRNTIMIFRAKLEKRTTRQYLYSAQQLHQWLITPLESLLRKHHIETLVFVPDGLLRTIPIAALHDGKQFLINKYAIVTAPGLELFDPKPLERKNTRILVNALTVPVQGFSALPNVDDEVKAIQKHFKPTILMNQTFLLKTAEKEIKEQPYSIVHIASHGQFDKDPDNTFILTYDGKLTINRLEDAIRFSKYRKQPLELLILSACQTAAGDEKAALGLAGIALKAGARSALATLWFINDKATSELIGEFYFQLKNPKNSKAKALQLAQLKLLKDIRYQHPGNWSPFLLIGNWL